jgi:hypothetical protein
MGRDHIKQLWKMFAGFIITIHTGPEESPFDVKDQGGLGDLLSLALPAEYDDGGDESPRHPAENCGGGICLHGQEQRGCR